MPSFHSSRTLRPKAQTKLNNKHRNGHKNYKILKSRDDKAPCIHRIHIHHIETLRYNPEREGSPY